MQPEFPGDGSVGLVITELALKKLMEKPETGSGIGVAPGRDGLNTVIVMIEWNHGNVISLEAIDTVGIQGNAHVGRNQSKNSAAGACFLHDLGGETGIHADLENIVAKLAPSIFRAEDKLLFS